MRVIDRVTRISAPSLRACCNARLASSSPELRPHHGLTVDDADYRPIVLSGDRAAPLLCNVRSVGPQPLERDLIAVEEPAHLGTERIPPVSEDDRARRRGLRRNALKAARSGDPVARE